MWKRALMFVAVCGFAVGMATAEPARATPNGTQVEYASNGDSTSLYAFGRTVSIPIVIAVSVASLD